MKNSFSLGLRQVQPEVITLQNPGFYWVTCARQQDMRAFIRQVISQQHAATLISAGLPPRELLTPDLTGGPDRIPLFSLPANKKSLLQLERDLSRTLSHKSGLVIFSSSTAQWDKLNEAELRDWITRMRRMLRKRNITLLIVTTGITLFNQTSSLQRYYRQIDGLVYLTVEQDSWRKTVCRSHASSGL